jgi:hypothetical protein
MLLLLGCSGKKTTEPTTTTTTGGATTGTTTGEEAVTLPDSLKNSAYDYKGLGNDSLRTYTATFPKQPTEDGTETVRLEKVEDGKATFIIERTGALSSLGTETVELSTKGVTTVAASSGVVTPMLELPADLHVGSSWTDKFESTQAGTTVKATVNLKAVREEKLKVPAGEFDCIVIENVMDATVTGGTADVNGTAKTTITAYYAKGIGIVKLVGKTVRSNGSTENLLIELKSIGE